MPWAAGPFCCGWSGVLRGVRTPSLPRGSGDPTGCHPGGWVPAGLAQAEVPPLPRTAWVRTERLVLTR